MNDPRKNVILAKYIETFINKFGDIPKSRTNILKSLGDYIISCLKDNGSAKLMFICTHNSRRSQFAQIWADTAVQYFDIQNIVTFSGGTEATAFNNSVLGAIQKAGLFVVVADDNTSNPVYKVSVRPLTLKTTLFSKTFDDPSNPEEDFCAIMVCSDADEACPVIPGAASRISLPYEDPKASDGTDLEIQTYDISCQEIARDMFFTFNYIKPQIT